MGEIYGCPILLGPILLVQFFSREKIGTPSSQPSCLWEKFMKKIDEKNRKKNRTPIFLSRDIYGCPILLLEQRNSGRQGKKVERLPSDHDSFAG